jgi:hypothetical protein
MFAEYPATLFVSTKGDIKMSTTTEANVTKTHGAVEAHPEISGLFMTPSLARSLASSWIDEHYPGAFISDAVTKETAKGWVFVAGELNDEWKIDPLGIPPVLVDRGGNIHQLSWDES